MRQRGEEKQGAAPKVVLLCGGGSGCVSNIIADRLMSKVGKYKLIVAGRTPMQPREGKDVPFVKFDIFQKGSLDSLVNEVKQFSDGLEIAAVVNCVSTGGKLSYDTTKIAYLNYVSTNALIHLATTLKCNLVHMSSMKVGTPENPSPTQMEGMPPWKGARSPYAWSKLAAELKMTCSDVKDMSFIRIGLMDSPHGKRFYTRVSVTCDFNIAVTQEADLQDAIETAIAAKGRHIVTCPFTKQTNAQFYRRMAGRSWIPTVPVFCFNYVFGNCIPSKMIDYVDPEHDFAYWGP